MTAVQFLFINKLTTPRYLSAPELLVNGFYLFPEPKVFSDFTLETANNKTINQDDLQGKWTLIYFGFTRCPDECPIAMSLIRNLYSTLEQKNFDFSDQQTMLVTIDPENDTRWLRLIQRMIHLRLLINMQRHSIKTLLVLELIDQCY